MIDSPSWVVIGRVHLLAEPGYHGSTPLITTTQTMARKTHKNAAFAFCILASL